MNKYKREDVLKNTLEYFNNDELASSVWINKYALKDKEGMFYELTPKDMHKRLAKEFARIEQKYTNPLSEQEIFELLDKFKYIVPQGSPMFGIGNDFVTTSLSNCFVVGNNNNSDSYGSIMRTDEEQVQLMKRRGGVGHDISHLRPSGAMANNSILKGMAGSTLYMDRFSNSTREVSQGERRGALLLSINVNHPDVDKFIDAKLENGKVTGANISVKLTDEFINYVKNNEDFYQTFPINKSVHEIYGKEIVRGENDNFEYDKLYESENGYFKKIKARKLWNKIIHNAWRSAEPGVMFWDTMLKESPADCYGKYWKSVSCNPCGEIVLCSYDSCRLLAINLYSYVDKPFTKDAMFNFDLFKDHVNIAQRLMDDLVDLEIEKLDKIISKIKSDPESEDIKRVELNLWKKIREKAIQGRRTGLGITAEGDMLAALNIKYGTKEATEFTTEVHKVLATESYKSSIKMAKERGCFEIWDYEKEYRNNPFINRVLDEIWVENKDIIKDYQKYGRRNIANLTIAPTGSVSILTQTTSGIEPAFQVYYKRRRKVNEKEKATFIDEVGDMWEEYNVFHHKFIEWFNVNKLNFVGIDEIDLNKLTKEELDELIKMSPYHNATSSNIDYIEKVKMQGAIQKWVDHSISVTVNMPENVSEEMVSDVYMQAYESGCKGVTVYREGSRSGVLISDSKKETKENDSISYNEANKRPETLKCDIYNISRNKTPHTIIVGKLNNRPYEIFVLDKLANTDFPDKIKEGKITKVKSRCYQLEGECSGKLYKVENLTDLMTTDEQKDTRKYSLMLRHGIKPRFIIEQINEFATITSFDKVIAKVLSDYLEGEKVKQKTNCPNCNAELRFEGGCNICPECGWSACG